MHIAVIGTGYVGLVSGACLAESGNDVTCVDIDAAKVARLQNGDIPIYEPGLEELVARSSAAGRLHFTTDLAAAVRGAKLVMLAVGTPSGPSGQADLSALWAAVDQLAPHLPADCAVVTKSTVPVGTCAGIEERLSKKLGRACDVASNPEFLKEGAAIEDFVKPDRVVVGVRRQQVAEVLRDLYSPFLRTEKPFLVMSPESAELTKYVANALLATKISFINEMANVCGRMGADINDVRRGIGHDSRIGFAFLFPGVGYGGSCFPKDIRALASMFRQHGLAPRILDAIDTVNNAQKTVLLEQMEQHFGAELGSKTFAVWGLSFKPRTDDIREAPALATIDQLLSRGCRVRVHDPEALANARRHFESHPRAAAALTYCERQYEALEGADALAILTEWKEFLHPDFDQVKRLLKQPVIFDGRNVYNTGTMQAQGFYYYSIGRAAVRPAT